VQSGESVGNAPRRLAGAGKRAGKALFYRVMAQLRDRQCGSSHAASPGPCVVGSVQV